MAKKQNILVKTNIEEAPFTNETTEDVVLRSPKTVTPLDILSAEELPFYTNEKTSFIVERKTDTQRILIGDKIILNTTTKPTENTPELYSLSSGSRNERYSPLDEEMGKYFKLKDLISYDYKNPTYYALNNYPGIDTEYNGEDIVQNLKDLMENSIDKIIEKHPNFILVSAYRSLTLNRMIGGSHDNNHHVKGCAIDFKVSEEHTSYIFNWCIQNLNEWHELMWAYPERGNKSWIHLSYKKGQNFKRTILASEREDIHKSYNGERRGLKKEYQEGILKANQELI